MLFRLIGVSLVIFCSSCYGVILKLNYRKRITYLERLLLHLEEIQGFVKYQNVNFAQIIEQLPYENFYGEFFGQVLKSLKEGESLNNAWKKGVKLKLENTVLQKRELEIIGDLGEQLGLSNRETQMKQLDFFRDKIKRIHKEMKIEEKEKCKLYTSLGVMSGIFISIVLI